MSKRFEIRSLLRGLETLVFFLWSANFGAAVLLTHLRDEGQVAGKAAEDLDFRLWLSAGPLLLAWGLLNWTRLARERAAVSN